MPKAKPKLPADVYWEKDGLAWEPNQHRRRWSVWRRARRRGQPSVLLGRDANLAAALDQARRKLGLYGPEKAEESPP